MIIKRLVVGFFFVAFSAISFFGVWATAGFVIRNTWALIAVAVTGLPIICYLVGEIAVSWANGRLGKEK